MGSLPHKLFWRTSPRLSEEKLSGISELPPLLVQLLYNRGISTAETIQEFLFSEDLHEQDVTSLKGIPEAVDRIMQAVSHGEKIVVFGDYDVDGLTSAALLTQALRSINADVTTYIPDRASEGCGLNSAALDGFVRNGVKLVITTDCGISNAPEVAYAQALGIDVVVTDHHHPPQDLPSTYATINPKQPGCLYPFKDFCGVGLAFKLAQALGISHEMQESLLDLVALGTVADLAPLVGENRVLVRKGLEQLHKNIRPGLSALIRVSNIQAESLTERDIAFSLAPRLNAAGRVGSADIALSLLVATDEAEAEELAAKLNDLNSMRQVQTEEAIQLGREQAKDQTDLPVVIVGHEAWNVGILGLVAAKLSEELSKPVLALSKGETESRGSARSPRGFNIIETLSAYGHQLERFGGHAQAAGLTIQTTSIDHLHTYLCEAVTEYEKVTANGTIEERDAAVMPEADCNLALKSVSVETYNVIQQLAPFGVGNPEPIFINKGSRISHLHTSGVQGQHFRFRLSDGEFERHGVWYRMAPYISELASNQRVDIAFNLNCFTGSNGNPFCQIKVVEMATTLP